MRTKHKEVKADHMARKHRPPLIPSSPQSHRDDGSPVAANGQAYVTRTGKQYHTRRLHGWGHRTDLAMVPGNAGRP